jgi:hypothetical protein
MVNSQRWGCAAASLPNGKILIVGGSDASDNPLASAEIYDPSTELFTATGNMTTPREEPTAILLNTGKVLIAGGWNSASPYYLSSAEIYDSTSGTFSSTGSMTASGIQGTAILLNSGKVLIAGLWGLAGNTSEPAELYDPSSGTFSEAATPLAYSRFSNISMTSLPNGLVFIAGGLLGNGGVESNSPNQTEFYDPATNSFYAGPHISQERDMMTMTQLQNGNVLIVGGTDQDVYYPTYGAPPASDIYIPASTNPIPAVVANHTELQMQRKTTAQLPLSQTAIQLP